MAGYDLHTKVASIVSDAGGELVGRTRLQKIAYLSQLAGYSDDFSFEYHHYGPFSEDLADAVKIATGLKLVHEEERRTSWGGRYSVFKCDRDVIANEDRARFIAVAANLSAIELELAATAAYLHLNEGFQREADRDPWEETARRKSDKAADGRLDRAKVAYQKLLQIETPRPLPPIV